MCAIAGVIGLATDSAVADKMLSTMRRRGPDGKGMYHKEQCMMLHSRLAIIDPDGGVQPMRLSWGNECFILTYNGELYNTAQLRKELVDLGHTFEGSCDTEVLLHAYAQWKEAVLERLNGIYAFGVWHEKEKKLFLARDRIGVKPLFFVKRGTGLLFASEMKTLFAHPCVKPELDAVGVSQILLLGPGRLPGDGVFRGVEELEPGCCATFYDGKLNIRRYWKLTDGEHIDDLETTAETVRWLVFDAIKRQMVADVPVGTFLSGGLDSSIITAVCANAFASKGEKLNTFSVGYEDNDKYFTVGKFQPNADDSYIHLMQATVGSEHHQTVLDQQTLFRQLEDATIARDLPGMADVDFSLLAFCGQIRKNVKVALSGECADEIFGGYPWYRDPEIRNTAGFPWAQNTGYRQNILHPGVAQKVDGAELVNDAYRMTIDQSDIAPDNSPQERRMKEMVNLNFRWFMQTLLDRKDRMSMFHGLEVRVPFCDHRIAEYMYRVPWEMKDLNGEEKGLLRYAVRGILPDAVAHRKKSPYPKTHHPAYGVLVEDGLRQLCQQKDAPLFRICSKEAVQNLLYDTPRWPWYGQLMTKPQTIAYMLQINFWLKHYEVDIIID